MSSPNTWYNYIQYYYNDVVIFGGEYLTGFKSGSILEQVTASFPVNPDNTSENKRCL